MWYIVVHPTLKVEDVPPKEEPEYYCATDFRYDLCCQQQCIYCVYMEEPDPPKPGTATAVLAAINESQRRFTERLKKLTPLQEYFRAPNWSYPEHKDYLKFFPYPQGLPDWLRSVPRSRALVRLSDCPIFVMYVQCEIRGMNYSAIDPTCLIWILDRVPYKVKVPGTIRDWQGTYGSEGR